MFDITQSTAFISALLGIAGTIGVARSALSLTFDYIFKSTGPRKSFYSSIDDAYSLLDIKYNAQFGTFLLALSYIVILVGLLFNDAITVKLNSVIILVLTLLFTVFIWSVQYYMLKSDKEKMKTLYDKDDYKTQEKQE